MTDEAAEAIPLYLDLLVKGPPRLVTRVTAQPLFLFTDSQALRDVVWGACFWTDAHGKPLRFFSLELTRDQRKALGEGCTSSIIFEAELCAAILAMVLWKDVLCGRPVVATAPEMFSSADQPETEYP